MTDTPLTVSEKSEYIGDLVIAKLKQVNEKFNHDVTWDMYDMSYTKISIPSNLFSSLALFL